MALTPEQKQEAHQRGLRLRAEREAREESQKPEIVSRGVEYDRFRRIGLTHEEALQEVEKRRIAEEIYLAKGGGSLGNSNDKTYIGPRGGRYRMNSNNRKSYDVR